MPHLTITEWLLAMVAAAGVGISKAGLSGMSLVHVLIFAFLFGARESTGVVLPMLLFGDIFAVRTFHQHARWDYVRRMLPPACVGVITAAWFMRGLSESVYKPIIGGIILADNVLWSGRVLNAENEDENTKALYEFSKKIQADERVSNILLTVRDGLMLIRKERD